MIHTLAYCIRIKKFETHLLVATVKRPIKINKNRHKYIHIKSLKHRHNDDTKAILLASRYNTIVQDPGRKSKKKAKGEAN